MAMGKRLFRYKGSEIHQKLNEVTNREIDVIINDKSTIHGVLLSGSADEIWVKDKRRKIHQILLSRVQEIILDQEAPY